MQFLKSKVRGEAERLIQHLQISSDNYIICWDILNNRYNNPKLIFTSHMNILMSLPVSQQASVTNIKKIHDTTLECLNAIKNLGIDISTWDPIIVYLLTQKLDNETHHDYVQSLKCPRELPKLQDFLEFLEQTFMSMESGRKKQDNTHQKSYIPSNKNQYLKTPKSSYFKQSYASNRLTTQHPSNISSKGATSPNLQAAKNKNFITYICPLCSKDHGLFFCQEFLDMSPQTRRKTVTKLNVCQNCLFSHQGKACISEKRCRECNENHNTMLHDAFRTYSNKPQNNANVKNKSSMSSEAENNRISTSNSNVTQQNNDMTEILLATAMLKVRAADGTYKIMRTLIDQGSQVSIISENAAQRLAHPRRNCKGSIFGVGVKPNSCKGVLDLTCSSMDDNYVFDTSVFIMQNLIKQLPNSTFAKPSWSFLNNIQLADPDFNISRPVDLLLGADIYSNILLPGICREEDHSVPIAQQTRLGWILCGSTKTYQCNVILNNIEQIEKFWETEDITEHSNLSAEDLQCIQYYEETTKRLSDGRYEVRLPLKPGYEKQLGSSKNKAIAQFLSMERKFRKNSSFGQNYKAFIHEYLALGHLKPADSVGRLECYLPHHGVERLESTTTALRVVFNGSCKTSTGSSLNDVMFADPNLQQDLQEPEIRKNKITAKSSLVSICAALLFFLSIFVLTHGAYTIQQLNQSLYFDAISNIQLIRDDWKLIIYYNMQPFWEGSEALDKYQKHMENICETLKGDGHCDAILLQLRHSTSELEYYNRMLLGKQTEHDRQKRGLINGVGYLANSLFGVLDDHFAEKYERDITLVRQNEHHLASLFKNQTSIIEAEYNMMKRMEEVMRKQHKIINKQISALDSNINKVKTELEKLHSINQFLALSVIANNLLLDLKGIQNMMTDAITDTYHGRFDVHLISPTQLKNELNTISGQIPKDLTLPISNIQSDFQKMYQFLQVKTKLTKKYLIFEIRLPFCRHKKKGRI